jgi:plastocyanin
MRQPLSDPLAAVAVPGAVALALLLGACASDEPAEDPVAGEEEGDTEVAEDPAGDEGAVEPAVQARDLEFDPATLVIPAGTTVTWTNEDTVDHTVTAGTADEPLDTFDEPLGAEGGTAELTFDEPGTVVYHCTIHPEMVGRIEVE